MLTELFVIDNGITNDILAMEIRQTLHHLGEITCEITNDELLDNIFSKFCIGKYLKKVANIKAKQFIVELI